MFVVSWIGRLDTQLFVFGDRSLTCAALLYHCTIRLAVTTHPECIGSYKESWCSTQSLQHAHLELIEKRNERRQVGTVFTVRWSLPGAKTNQP